MIRVVMVCKNGLISAELLNVVANVLPIVRNLEIADGTGPSLLGQVVPGGWHFGVELNVP
jgi:hypothetical protein